MAKPIEPEKAIILIATKTNTHIELICETVADNAPVTVRVPFAKFDEAANSGRGQYVPDAETAARANELLKKATGLDVNTIVDKGPGKPITVWVRDDRAYLFEVKPRTRFTPLTAAEAGPLRKAAAKGQVFETLPLTEWANHRLNFGFAFTMPDGQVRNYRISQFATGKDSPAQLGTKYASARLQAFADSLENSSASAELKAQAQARLNELLAQARAKRIAELDRYLHIDVEKMLKNDDTLKVYLSVLPVGHGEYYYAVATLADE